jgi:hypothetical protein
MQTMEFLFSDSRGEDVDSMLVEREVLKIDDHVMNELPDKIHMDLNMFFLLSL